MSANDRCCPFCGSKNTRVVAASGLDRFNFFCASCGAHGPSSVSREGAQGYWNQRVKDAPPPAPKTAVGVPLTPSQLNALQTALARAVRVVDDPEEARAPELKEVGTTGRGHTLFRVENEAGGHRYWSDAIGGGVCIWDTSLASEDELICAMAYEKQRAWAEITKKQEAKNG